MVDALPGWTPEMERPFKEVLFRFLEEVHCTKAALYLLAPQGSYVLASQYGFGRRDRISVEQLDTDEMVVTAQGLGADPLAVNDKENFPGIAEYLQGAGNSRMLLTPIRLGSTMVGFVDARDKGGRRPFETADVRQGSIIAGSLLEVVQRLGLYGDLAEEEPVKVKRDRPPTEIGSESAPEALLDEAGVSALQESAMEIVVREGMFAAALTIATADEASTLVVSGVAVDAVDTEALTRHQSEALVHAGVPAPHHSSWKVEVRPSPGADGNPGSSLIATRVPLHDDNWSLSMSVVSTEGGPSPEAALQRLCREVKTAHKLTALRYSRRGLARRLLEPGERTYPELYSHSLVVSKLCWRMARALDMDDQSSEQAALVGLLHDVGMRELDYDRLYLHPSPSVADRRIYRQHPAVGERILHGTGLDHIARAVRHHHERWDGNGYPDQLAGDEIPQLARLVHVAEVFDVLTAAASYRSTVPSKQALVAITTAAGQQFDPDMVEVLTRVVG